MNFRPPDTTTISLDAPIDKPVKKETVAFSRGGKKWLAIAVPLSNSGVRDEDDEEKLPNALVQKIMASVERRNEELKAAIGIRAKHPPPLKTGEVNAQTKSQ
jgi:hypothetical protein